MKYLLTLIILFSTISNAKEINCNIHKIYCDMKKLRPGMDNNFAMGISNSIYRWSKYYGFDAKRSVAIMMQESYLGHFKNRVIKGVIKTRLCENKSERLSTKNSSDDFFVIDEEKCWGIGCPPGEKDYEICRDDYKVVNVLADLSIWQFQPYTTIKHGMDLTLLQTDTDYATQQHFRLLRIKYRDVTCKKKWPNSRWACYHSTTSVHHKKYIKDVNRWYRKIR